MPICHYTTVLLSSDPFITYLASSPTEHMSLVCTLQYIIHLILLLGSKVKILPNSKLIETYEYVPLRIFFSMGLHSPRYDKSDCHAEKDLPHFTLGS